jgi:hypothetical protein
VKISNVLYLCLPLLISAEFANAQDIAAAKNTFYIGGGSAIKDDPLKNSDAPFSIGFMHQPANNSLVFGFDLAGEGTSLDSTYRKNQALSQAISYNFLLGTNLIDSGRFTADAALIVGIREASADCPDSFLGYACYADTSPTIEYKGNFGAVVTMSVDQFTLGLRATDQSTQFVVGIKF